MACTTILVGKKASYDGSTLVARNEDSGSGSFKEKKRIVVHPEDQPKLYKSVISHLEIELPDSPMKYTCTHDALGTEGIWGAFGVNEENISMTATETLTTNNRVLGADPLVEYIPAKGKPGDSDYQPEQAGGIGEEDMVTLVLPYIHSAREGVLRLGELLEKFGTYEMNGIAFQDVEEIWWLETIGGHHWIAKRVPDDHYVVMPNQLGIDSFDLEDAFGEQKEHLCSKDLREFIDQNFLNVSFGESLNPRLAFGSHTDADHVYNTPRAWVIERYFNPKTYKWDGPDADYSPVSDDIPWALVPENKVTVEDIKYALSHHYQGTPYAVYIDDAQKPFRPIGINRNNVLGLVQIRPYVAKELQCVEWIAFGSNVFNALVPFYATIDHMPSYLSNTGEFATTENFYWINRIIAALADPHFKLCAPDIERYQDAVQSQGHALLNKYDALLTDSTKVIELCEKANDEMIEFLKVETNKLLNTVLYTASQEMQNSFSRSDG